MYCVKLTDVFLSSSVILRLSLKLFTRGRCQSQGGGQEVAEGGSARATLLLVKGMCLYSPGLGLTPDYLTLSEKSGTF